MSLVVDLGFYLTRDGRIVEITVKSYNDIWPFEGHYAYSDDIHTSPLMWTEYGGYNSDLRRERSIPEDMQLNQDLVKRITKEQNPEYFL